MTVLLLDFQSGNCQDKNLLGLASSSSVFEPSDPTPLAKVFIFLTAMSATDSFPVAEAIITYKVFMQHYSGAPQIKGRGTGGAPPLRWSSLK